MNNTLHKGPFPLEIIKSDDKFIIITSQGTHYATTHDPSAARLIAAAPELLVALKQCIPLVAAHANAALGEGVLTLQVARAAIAKAKGGK
jgi:hypothetical protein